MGKAKLDPIRNPSQFQVIKFLSEKEDNAFGLSQRTDFPTSYSVAYREIEDLFSQEILIKTENNKYMLNYEKINEVFFNYLYKKLNSYYEEKYESLIGINDALKEISINDFKKEFSITIKNNSILQSLFKKILRYSSDNTLSEVFDSIISFFTFQELELDIGKKEELIFFTQLSRILFLLYPHNTINEVRVFFMDYEKRYQD